MAIGQKDIKILWGKAAGRCAMTKKKVLEPGSTGVPSGQIVIGEACHIVAESDDGPRGKSLLSAEDRNRYPNLILLSADSHTKIDKDPTAWPIEKLHQLKADHELWVEEQLTIAKSHEDEVYTNFIEQIGTHMELNHWEWHTSLFASGMLRNELAEGSDQLKIQLAKAIWPGKFPKLEAEIDNLVRRFGEMTKWHFKHCTPEEQFWKQDRFYRRHPETRNYAAARIFELWGSICRLLLHNVTHALNAYADQVRMTLKPDYFYVQGRFGIFGSSFSIPSAYQDIKELQTTYHRWMDLLGQKDGVFQILTEDEEMQKQFQG